MSTVLYVGAVGRSGTTLIERAIGTSPSFVSLGEVVHLWHRGLELNESCGCGLAFQECAFWSAVADRAFGGWSKLNVEQVRAWQRTVDRNRFIPMLIWPRFASASFRTALAGFTGILDQLYTAISEQVDPGVVLVDASKHPSYLFVLRHLRLHRPRLLHVVRDPRGVAHSWAKVVHRPDGAGDDMERLGALRASGRWLSHNLIFQLAGRLSVRRRRLRYDRFVADPAELPRTVGHLTADLGSTLPTFDGTTIYLGLNHTVSGNPMRFTTGPIQVRSDDGWRVSMPRLQRLTVSVLTLPLRLAYRW